MSNPVQCSSIAVIGAGIAGAACATSLRDAGHQVSLFDKSRGVGGRMATRRARLDAGDGSETPVEFDHGAQLVTATHPRFRAVLQRAQTAGVVQPWTQRVHAEFPGGLPRRGFVATPSMPALVRHLIGDLPLHTGHAVVALQRQRKRWQLTLDDGSTAGPFDQVVLALPPAQAAALLDGQHAVWAQELQAVRMDPCWTLMAVTADVDWPWDAAVPARGPLGWVARNDRAPGRSAPAGCATWVAHATPAWTRTHLEDDADSVQRALLAALAQQLPGGRLPALQHAVVHRWRYARPAGAAPDRRECWWDARRGLGVCGDFLAGCTVEAAWRSGDELACTVAEALEHDDHAVAETA